MKKTPTQLALDALERIDRHEKICGDRWAEAHQEIRALRERWEKLAWKIISALGLAIVTVGLDILLT
tara:strand:- start:40 stop:240 length:201 start_codon:yes stop_codon:yes gene_type:complete